MTGLVLPRATVAEQGVIYRLAQIAAEPGGAVAAISTVFRLCDELGLNSTALSAEIDRQLEIAAAS